MLSEQEYYALSLIRETIHTDMVNSWQTRAVIFMPLYNTVPSCELDLHTLSTSQSLLSSKTVHWSRSCPIIRSFWITESTPLVLLQLFTSGSGFFFYSFLPSFCYAFISTDTLQSMISMKASSKNRPWFTSLHTLLVWRWIEMANLQK